MMFELVVVSAVSVFRKTVYHVLNSLVIFCVAMGSGNFAHELQQRNQTGIASLSYIGTAYAQADGVAAEASERYLTELEAITNDPTLTPVEKQKKIEEFQNAWKSRQGSAVVADDKSGGFFKSWSISGK